MNDYQEAAMDAEEDGELWPEDYWQMDQAVMDAEEAKRPQSQVDRLRRIRDSFASFRAADRIQYDDDGELDEFVVGDCQVHLERMSRHVWFLGVRRGRERVMRMFLRSKRKVWAHVDETTLRADGGGVAPAPQEDREGPRCDVCGYSWRDQQIHGDHYLCTGSIPDRRSGRDRRYRPAPAAAPTVTPEAPQGEP